MSGLWEVHFEATIDGVPVECVCATVRAKNIDDAIDAAIAWLQRHEEDWALVCRDNVREVVKAAPSIEHVYVEVGE
jgi:bacterioferritin-associated ferredoxin